MKKILSLSLLALSLSLSAQMSFAAKFNVLFPAGNASWKNISNSVTQSVEAKGRNNVGFNLGLSLKLNLTPSWFLMSELYYTSIKSEYTAYNVNFAAKSHTLDVPVLVGHNFLGDKVGVYAGPMFSYQLSKDNTYNEFVERFKSKDYKLGYQVGAQLLVKKFIFSARYQGAFNSDERIYTDTAHNQTVTYDNKNTAVIFAGIGYKFN